MSPVEKIAEIKNEKDQEIKRLEEKLNEVEREKENILKEKKDYQM